MPAITENEYKRLKADVESARQEADRAQGALDGLMVRLKDEFGCEGVKEARAHLSKLQAQATTAQQAFEKAVTEYRERWHEGEG